MKKPAAVAKPPYRIPSMAEIRRVPLNGLKVASTFSGCGGSCLGFRWAGFEHVYANEFIPAARETYAANFPGSRLDDRDIRVIQPADILEGTGLGVGDLDVLEGSPPCASFSTAGKGAKAWGEVKKYSDTKQRTDDLFGEFTRLLVGLKPKAFVAENVAGLVRGAAKGYFIEIVAAMEAAGYVVACRVLDAQWLGVPQTRKRTIFVGIRRDLADAGTKMTYPAPLPYRYSIADALPWIAGVHHDSMGQEGTRDFDVDREPICTIRAGGGGAQTMFEVKIKKFGSRDRVKLDSGEPAPTLMVAGMGGVSAHQDLVGADPSHPSSIEKYPSEPRKFTIPELRRLGGFPDDFVLTGGFQQQWERIGRAVPPPMMMAVAAALRDSVFGGGRRVRRIR